MADRKVLNKYFPKNFDHDRLVKRGRGKDKLMIVRNMLPMSLRCNTCANYLYIGTKFNMRMEICNDQVYLGIKVFRFYLKCTYCYADITFKTDPKNHDYVVQDGGTRNYQPIKDAQQAEKLLKKMKTNQKQGDSMKYLQTKTYDSKRQMQLMETLQDIKNLNKRQAIIDPQDLLKNIIYEQDEEDKFTQQQQNQIDARYIQLCKKRQQRINKQLIQSKQGALKLEQCSQAKQIKSVDCNLKQMQTNLSGKKFNSLLIKSKLDKYKKKIIKKNPKGQKFQNSEQVEQILQNKQQNA